MLTKWLRRLTVSKHHALNLTSCSFTQTAHVQGNQSFHWANRHHMLTWLGKRLTQGNAAPLEHLNNIYRTKSTLSTVAGLGCQGGSSFTSTSVVLMNIKGQGIHSSAGAFASCPPVWGIWQDFRHAEQLQPPQAAQKKAAGKSLWFQ